MLLCNMASSVSHFQLLVVWQNQNRISWCILEVLCRHNSECCWVSSPDAQPEKGIAYIYMRFFFKLWFKTCPMTQLHSLLGVKETAAALILPPGNVNIPQSWLVCRWCRMHLSQWNLARSTLCRAARLLSTNSEPGAHIGHHQTPKEGSTCADIYRTREKCKRE